MGSVIYFITSLFVLAVFGSGARGSPLAVDCGLFRYYDPVVDDCAPCSEWCLFQEESKCQEKCPDYLTASKCTYLQYYDDVVGRCALCSELCRNYDVWGPSKDCSDKCHNYLKAQNCTDEEYFRETTLSCSACSDLCSQQDEQGKATVPECFTKCPVYVARYPPGKIIGHQSDGDDPANTGRALAHQPKASSSESLHPGVYLAIGIGSLAIVATLAIVGYLCRKQRLQAANYDTAQGDDDHQQEMPLRHGVKESDPYAPSAHCYSPSTHEHQLF